LCDGTSSDRGGDRKLPDAAWRAKPVLEVVNVAKFLKPPATYRTEILANFAYLPCLNLLDFCRLAVLL
jgi:hypothetical protein